VTTYCLIIILRVVASQRSIDSHALTVAETLQDRLLRVDIPYHAPFMPRQALKGPDDQDEYQEPKPLTGQQDIDQSASDVPMGGSLTYPLPARTRVPASFAAGWVRTLTTKLRPTLFIIRAR
jgi:hypothetical protein